MNFVFEIKYFDIKDKCDVCIKYNAYEVDLFRALRLLHNFIEFEVPHPEFIQSLSIVKKNE